MIVAVPELMPVTMPVPEPMVAMSVLLLVQAPPPVISESVADVPTHTVNGPVMAAGPALTVSVRIATQPVWAV